MACAADLLLPYMPAKHWLVPDPHVFEQDTCTACGRVEQRSVHEAYWLWQASVLPWANAPEAPITSDDVNNRKAIFMDAP